MTKPFMIVLVGAPGSGKSTYSANYVAWCQTINQPVTVLSTDDIVMRMSAQKRDGVANYSEDFKNLIGAAQKEFDAGFAQALQAKTSIIIDRTNMTRKVRSRFVQEARKNGYNVTAMVFEVPEAALKYRLEKRAKEPGNKFISRAILESMLNSYERPSVDEGFTNVIDVT